MKRLRDRYVSLSAMAKASFWFLFCNIAQKAVSMLTIPIITRMLTTDEYGTYSVFISYSNILMVLGTLTLYGNGYFVGMKRYNEEKNRYTSSMAGLMFTITMLLYMVFLLCQKQVTVILHQGFFVITLMFAWVLCNGAMNLWFVENRYEFKYQVIVICTLFTAFAMPVFKIAFILLFDKTGMDKALGAIIGYVFPIVIIGIIAWCMMFVKGRRTVYEKEYWKFALTFNIPLIPYYLSQTILNQADRFMIERLDSAGAAGIYSVAYSLAMMVSVINGAVNSTLIPWQFQEMKKGENRKVAAVVNLIMVIVASIHFLLIFVAPEAMKIFAAKEYYSAIYVVPPVTIGILVMWLTQIFINIEFFYEKNKWIAVSSVLSATVNIILNMVAIPRFGYLAAGYTTLICYLINMIFHGVVVVFLIKRNGNDRAFDLGKMIMVVVCSIIFMLFTMLLYKQTAVRWGIIIMAVTVTIWKRKEFLCVIRKIWKAVKEK